MLDALRTRGYHGVGLNELLTTAQAPKGVLYHHFPGGKAALAVHAVESVVAKLGADLDKVLQRAGDPADALGAWMAQAQRVLAGSGFASGCPLATIALESTPDDEAIRAALAKGFATIRTRLAVALAGAGMAPAQARGAAALIVSAYEGALLQARVAGSVQAMRDTSEALVGLLRLALGQRSTPDA
jgi:TetR/AcrR family transcriptional repressor of lmrAB and yxaGH operons